MQSSYMTNSLLNIAGKVDQPTIELYRAVAKAVEAIEAEYLVVGASARDLVFKHAYGIEIARATGDIDYGIHVTDWCQFDSLREILINDGFKSTKDLHRLISPKDLRVDIVPFGGIEAEDSSITWPPEHDFRLSVLGFKEALLAAVSVSFEPQTELVVPVASAEGFALLKTVCWTSREVGTRKRDALDLVHACRFYERLPYVELYDDDALLERFEYDVTAIGAYLLGRGVGVICGEECKDYISRFLRGDLSGVDIDTMVDESLTNPFSPREENASLLAAYSDGFLEV